MMGDKYLVYTEELAEAICTRKPIVALESTLIAHGMPYPQNFETAQLLEQIVRSEGAIPATIAILEGKICVGLAESQLHALATQTSIHKASRRDMSFILSQELSAATTVATTMMCAYRAGISFFATGGIGGVHRDVEKSWDISADLQEFTRSPVAVVSAGAKSILDLPKTLEYLETVGVPVVGYTTDEFPAFYSRSSGIPLSMRMESPLQLAEMALTHWELGFSSGILVANPIPEKYTLDQMEIEAAIEVSLKEAASRGIQGKELTPFLLGYIKDLTEGRSLAANIELVKNNARLAAQTAVAYQSFVSSSR